MYTVLNNLEITTVGIIDDSGALDRPCGATIGSSLMFQFKDETVVLSI